MNDLSVTTNSGLMPQTLEEKYKMADVLSRSGLIPQGLNTPEKVCVALQWGHELGLSPMVAVNNVAVINGKPTLSADIMAAVARRSPEYGGIEWKELSDTCACCIIKRILPNGAVEQMESRFTLQDAQRAGLTNKQVWKMYPRRMLKHRCLSYGLKDMFPDILAGLYTPEEMENIPTETEPERIVSEPAIQSEQPKTENIIAPQNIQTEQVDKKRQLEDLLYNYEQYIDDNAFAMCQKAVSIGDENDICDKLNRLQNYLRAQGVNV